MWRVTCERGSGSHPGRTRERYEALCGGPAVRAVNDAAGDVRLDAALVHGALQRGTVAFFGFVCGGRVVILIEFARVMVE